MSGTVSRFIEYSSSPERRWRLLISLAVAAYGVFASLLIAQRPGLQYDESLLVLGAVHMRHSPGELGLPHDPDTWVCLFGRCIPLMSVRYVGALKEYLCLPFFALFGPGAEIIRGVSAASGAIGLVGMAALSRRIAGASASVLTTFALAVNPSYIDLTVFDNGAVAGWMAAFGCAGLAVSRYCRAPSAGAAAWCGAAFGLGLWARANFAWLLAALFIALAAVFGRRVFGPASHWLSFLGGFAVTSFPFWVYQVLSGGGTWEAVGMFSVTEGWRQLVFNRAVMFAETLLSNREHRAIWGGPPMPSWQLWLFPSVVLLSCLYGLASRGSHGAPRRVAAILTAVLASFLFFSRLPVAEHHFVVLVPFAVLVTVIASAEFWSRSKLGKVAVAGLLCVYVASAMQWNVAAVRGIRTTGGTGQWSDAIFKLADFVESSYAGREILILDWGLQNSLYVLSDGKIQSRELFATDSPEDHEREVWLNRIQRGGLFLFNGSTNRHFAEPTTIFLATVRSYQPALRRHSIRERSGRVFAELFDIPAFSGPAAPAEPEEAAGRISRVQTGNADHAGRLEGFHQIEEGGWRWAAKRFAVTLDSPRRAPFEGVRVELAFYLPPQSFQQLGPVTLAGRLNDCSLAPSTYREPGRFVYARSIEERCLGERANRLEFFVDKGLDPAATDGRELAIVVEEAALEPE
jgi:hypothetical protein